MNQGENYIRNNCVQKSLKFIMKGYWYLDRPNRLQIFILYYIVYRNIYL